MLTRIKTMENVTITKKEYEELKEKASQWDKLGKNIDEFYALEEEQEDGLTTIGEMAAEAFGYL